MADILNDIPEGQLTGRIYGMIRDGEFDDAIQILRAAL